MPLINRNDRRHVYEQAADIIRERIRSGCYAPSQEIPSMARMAAEFEIGDLTMERALYKLRDEGWLLIRQGHATRVASKLPAENSNESLRQMARDLVDQATRLMQAIEAMA